MSPPPRRGGGGGPRREPSRREGGLGGEQVEGRHAVRELLRVGRRRVQDVWLAEGADPAPILGEIEQLAEERRVPIRRVMRGRLEGEARTDAPQGVLAHADPLPESTLEDLAAGHGARPGPAFLVAFDGVTDPHNLGAVLRTAEVAGATGALLPRHRSAHVTPTVAKAAAGAVEHVPMALVAGLPAALARLKDLGVWIVGLDGEADTSVHDLALATEPLVLVLGAEGTGLGRLTSQRCDLLVRIPQVGATPSLNVSAAGAVACFEVARRRAG